MKSDFDWKRERKNIRTLQFPYCIVQFSIQIHHLKHIPTVAFPQSFMEFTAFLKIVFNLPYRQLQGVLGCCHCHRCQGYENHQEGRLDMKGMGGEKRINKSPHLCRSGK